MFKIIKSIKPIIFLMIILSGIHCMKDKSSFKPNRIFIDFQEKLKNVNLAEEKQQAADEFMAAVKESEYPIFENDTTVVLLYQGDKDTVGVLGDMGNWAESIEFNRIENTNVFYLRANFQNNARLEYWLSYGKKDWPSTDKLNPYIVLNGFGPISELAMPKYERHPVFDDYLNGQKGSYLNIETHELPAGVLPYSKTVHVYLPAEYKTSTNNYPCVFVQDGEDYIEFAQASVVLDKLISTEQIEPMIGVFIAPPNRHKPEMPNRMTEYGLNDDYVNFMADELVPFIDSTYRTEIDPSARMVVGDSFGGLISAYVPFLRPEVFGIGYSQSGYVSYQKDSLIKLYQEAERKTIFLYVDTGLYERSVGANMLPADETDFLMANRRFKKVLDKKGYDVIYKEYPEGHTWGNWRRHFIDGLIYYFGI